MQPHLLQTAPETDIIFSDPPFNQRWRGIKLECLL